MQVKHKSTSRIRLLKMLDFKYSVMAEKKNYFILLLTSTSIFLQKYMSNDLKIPLSGLANQLHRS